jgi:hypothetical protein
MLSPKYGFPAFDGNRDGKLTRRSGDVMRAMLAAENGLLAIKLGGKGDVTERRVKWKYTRPVPQVPSTLLYKGVLFMVNDSGILLSIDPATGTVLKQGRLKGAIDKYFASPVGADGKVFLVSQDGTASVVDAKGSGRSCRSTRSATKSSPRRRSPTARSTSAPSRRSTRSRGHRSGIGDRDQGSGIGDRGNKSTVACHISMNYSEVPGDCTQSRS